MSALALRAARLLRKSPVYVLRRLAAEMRAESDRFLEPRRARAFNVDALLARNGEDSLLALWRRLAEQPWPMPTAHVEAKAIDALVPESSATVLRRAEHACRHEVDLLGSGPTQLGERIDWATDFKTGDRWAEGYFRDIRIVDRTRPSDVKIPWELSRLQWLVPVGQAYLLTGEQRYAECTRAVLDQWIEANPIGQTVNWGIAMEPAMRIFVWTWLFRVFARAPAWQDPGFQGRLLCCLFQHGAFVYRYIERADLNGNHFTADCAALVVAGAFFGGKEGRRWLADGWADLQREITIQIHEDGVNFEASAAYHRFVGELFMLGGIFAEHSGLAMPAHYRARLAAVARFTAAYTKPDGTSPLWGDADDARALPLGTAAITDHRHLVACIATALDDPELARLTPAGWDEAFWLFGPCALHGRSTHFQPDQSAAFPAGGAYVLRTARGHVFIDCGHVGLNGRGGHGHNDILSFEASLGGVGVVSDAGCFVYTASFEERNRFRATAAHNTPQVDGEEINRFISPDLLWLLRDDSHPLGAHIREQAESVVFEGGHDGYRRLPQPVHVWRTIALYRDLDKLRVTDRFDGEGVHSLQVPLQLAVGWRLVESVGAAAVFTHGSGVVLRVEWDPESSWKVAVTDGDVATSYGVRSRAPRLEWSRHGAVSGVSLSMNLEVLTQDDRQARNG